MLEIVYQGSHTKESEARRRFLLLFWHLAIAIALIGVAEVFWFGFKSC
jgi:hypothetical protein